MLLEANFERDQKRSDFAFVLSPDSSENLRFIFYDLMQANFLFHRRESSIHNRCIHATDNSEYVF